MNRMTIIGRRGIVAAFAATIITTTACGTQTGTQVEDSVPQAPAAIQPPAGNPPTSADAAERRGAEQEPTPTAPPGMRVPDQY